FMPKTGALILAEVTAENHLRSDFYGFELLCRLRAEYRWTCPVGIASFMPPVYLSSRFPILDYPQHHPFLQLPATPASVENLFSETEPVGKARLNEIVMFYCDPLGRLIHLLTHGRAFHVLYKNKRPDRDFSVKFASDLEQLKRYLDVLPVPESMSEKVRQLLKILHRVAEKQHSEFDVSKKMADIVGQLAALKKGV
ncbi:hypothetical protein JW935_19555, partial [candidate division KSB1 bacterium]|nr:hypothetical protein [candidate division KSB1 bacterium]